MSQENLQTIIMQNFLGVKEVYYGIVQVVNKITLSSEFVPWFSVPSTVALIVAAAYERKITSTHLPLGSNFIQMQLAG